jgi:hypothetical protein
MSALNRFTFTSSAAALGLGLALSLSSGGCQQPQSYCTTGHGDFAATFKLTSGDAQSACGQFKGDVLGLQTYFAKGGLNGTPKFSEASMAIRPAYLGNLIDVAASYDPPVADPDEKHTPNAVGDFSTSLPDDDEFCAAPKFSVAEISLPELPLIPAVEDDPETLDVDETADEIPPVPATTVRYEWSNARVLVSANYQGTQFSADLKFTQDDCTAEYEVVGLYPVASCEADKDCQDTSVTAINPDFDLRCDKDLGLCVLKDEPPALN